MTEIKIGTTHDNLRNLKSLSESNAKDLCSSIVLAVGETKEISFWTSDYSELIAVAKFEKASDGKISYSMDYSQATL
ncbi:MAG: hypothetical protein NC210_01120 [[Clostridium] fimetarium]|nr:hypothetical protein [Alistipes timonensis]MCM1405005.1 hypothetical protein [[Clostridium] fimetarium]